jgi:hypothetical protein
VPPRDGIDLIVFERGAASCNACSYASTSALHVIGDRVGVWVVSVSFPTAGRHETRGLCASSGAWNGIIN